MVVSIRDKIDQLKESNIPGYINGFEVHMLVPALEMGLLNGYNGFTPVKDMFLGPIALKNGLS